MTHTVGRAAVAVLLASAWTTGAAAAESDCGRGAVVLAVSPGGAAARAGLQPGDVLGAWSQEAAPPYQAGPAAGLLDTPFDLAEVELERSFVASVTVTGRRAGEELSAVLPAARWNLTAGPCLSGRAAQILGTALRPDPGTAAGSGIGALAELARASRRRGDAALATWFEDRQGSALAAAVAQVDLEQITTRAITAATAAGEPRLAAHLKTRHGERLYEAGGDRDAMRSLLDAYRLGRGLAPETLAAIEPVRSGGRAWWLRGDLIAADRHYECAFAVQRRRIPPGLPAAYSLNNLGIVNGERGNYVAAESCYRRALSLLEGLEPGGLAVAATLNNLGVVATSRGDHVAAEDFFKRVVEILERKAPKHMQVAIALANLGGVVILQGDFERAVEWLERARLLLEEVAPESLTMANVLVNLGDVARSRGDVEAARELHQRAHTLHEQLAPASLYSASSLGALARDASDLGEPARAEALLRQSLAIHQRLAPDSAFEAESLHRLAGVLREGGRSQEALDLLFRAMGSLEAQQARLGATSEQLGSFRAQWLPMYNEGLELLLELERPHDAFAVMERSRAQALLAMMAEREVLFDLDIPPELERERQAAATAYDRAQAQLGALSPIESPDQVEAAAAGLRELRRRLDTIRRRVRSLSPRLADLQYPEPLDLAATLEVLDPGTALLAYAVGEASSVVFVIAPETGLEVELLPITADDLRGEIRTLRALHSPEWESNEGSALLDERASRLGERLLGPARAAIDRAQRLLIVPDGPLHMLPWAVLGGFENQGSSARYLVEQRASHVVASATVYRQLVRQRSGRARDPLRWLAVAFGDPLYAASDQPGSEVSMVRVLAARGIDLVPLPATRAEVDAIAALYGDQARVFLGADATETAAKSAAGRARIVHFACHGLLDERVPLDSGLALSIGTGSRATADNGILQAWEIFEQVRLDADLVTLSACSSGLGKEVAGEGLMGLTRAFQYAGARTVLASLWNVADLSTAELLARFYGHLKTGSTKDQALRAAQLELIRAPVEVSYRGTTVTRDLSHPFHWAAFQLYGDWQ